MKIKLSQSSKKNFEFDIQKNKILKSSTQNEDTIKNKILNKNEILENESNKILEYENKNNEEIKFIKEIEQSQKNKEDIKSDKKKNFSLEKYFKYSIKYNKAYIIFFYEIILNILCFSQLIKCNSRKIELAFSFINIKTKGTGAIKIYGNGAIKPNIVNINNIISLTDSEIQNYYSFGDAKNDINNITLI